jgi:hypothetical protein
VKSIPPGSGRASLFVLAYAEIDVKGMREVRRLKAGMVPINDQTIGDHPGIPMGDMGQCENGARFGSTTDLDEFTEWQWATVSVPRAIHFDQSNGFESEITTKRKSLTLPRR